MTTSSKTSFLITLDSDDKLQAQHILEDKYGINLVTYLRIKVKELLNAEKAQINAPANVFPDAIWRQPSQEEKQIFDDFDARQKAGGTKFIKLDEVLTRLEKV